VGPTIPTAAAERRRSRKPSTEPRRSRIARLGRYRSFMRQAAIMFPILVLLAGTWISPSLIDAEDHGATPLPQRLTQDSGLSTQDFRVFHGAERFWRIAQTNTG